MRLLFSVAVLLVLACVVIEISAAKSRRDAEPTKSNYKSENSKEVRYSKNKSDVKKKGNGKNGKVFKETNQRQNVEGNENMKSGFLKKNHKKMSEQVPREDQKTQKSDKKNKFDKTGENFQNNKNLKVNKDAAKKYKRSIDSERPKESLSRNEDPQMNSASKKEAKNKFEKKSGSGIGKTLHRQSESDAIVNTEEVSGDQPTKETASSLENNVKSSRKIKNAGEQRTKSKKTKQQKQGQKSEEWREETMDLGKSKSAQEKIQISEEFTDSDTEIKFLDNLPEKKSPSANLKKHKCSKKAPDAVSECESKSREEKSTKYKSASCDLEAKIAEEESRTRVEKSEYIAEIEGHETDDEDSKNVEINSADENEAQEDDSVEEEDCASADSAEEDVASESY